MSHKNFVVVAAVDFVGARVIIVPRVKHEWPQPVQLATMTVLEHRCIFCINSSHPERIDYSMNNKCIDEILNHTCTLECMTFDYKPTSRGTVA